MTDTTDALIAETMTRVPTPQSPEREPTLAEEITEAALDVQIAESQARVCALRLAKDRLQQQRGIPDEQPDFWLSQERQYLRIAMRHRETLRNLTGNAPNQDTGD